MICPMEQNHLLFRTPQGALAILAGETVRLNAALPHGIPVANYETIRVYGAIRPTSAVDVTIRIFVLQAEADELIFRLDAFTLHPGDSDITRTYEVPGRSLAVFATADDGIGNSFIDFGVLGFGPEPCKFEPCIKRSERTQ